MGFSYNKNNNESSVWSNKTIKKHSDTKNDSRELFKSWTRSKKLHVSAKFGSYTINNKRNNLSSGSNSGVKKWDMNLNQVRTLFQNIGQQLSLSSKAATHIPALIGHNYELNRLIHESELFYQSMNHSINRMHSISQLWIKYSAQTDYDNLHQIMIELGQKILNFERTITNFHLLNLGLKRELADLAATLVHNYSSIKTQIENVKIHSSLHKVLVLQLVESQEISRSRVLDFIRNLKMV